MEFKPLPPCPKCRNALNISKKTFNEKFETKEYNEELIKKIFKYIKDGNEQSLIQLLPKFDIDNIVQHELFNSLSKSEKNFLNDIIKKLDSNLSDFIVCQSCYYSEPLKEFTYISTIINTENNTAKYQTTEFNSDKRYSTLNMRTRDFVCPNDKCESHKKPEITCAIIDRIDNSTAVKYICEVCGIVMSNNK